RVAGAAETARGGRILLRPGVGLHAPHEVLVALLRVQPVVGHPVDLLGGLLALHPGAGRTAQVGRVAHHRKGHSFCFIQLRKELRQGVLHLPDAAVELFQLADLRGQEFPPPAGTLL
ncbi:MAG: hypothetical protein PWQ31_1744, partial [Eubacteriales bacterium]|nr:hypothetical protein [Eubacteriales bacterium]